MNCNTNPTRTGWAGGANELSSSEPTSAGGGVFPACTVGAGILLKAGQNIECDMY